MATMTISYDGRSSVMKHLIETMLVAVAKVCLRNCAYIHT